MANASSLSELVLDASKSALRSVIGNPSQVSVLSETSTESVAGGKQ